MIYHLLYISIKVQPENENQWDTYGFIIQEIAYVIVGNDEASP